MAAVESVVKSLDPGAADTASMKLPLTAAAPPLM